MASHPHNAIGQTIPQSPIAGRKRDANRRQEQGPRAPANNVATAPVQGPAPARDPAGDAGPRRIGRFTVLECIGSGAMGEVYAAYDDKLDRKVALKLVRPGAKASTRAQDRLLREAQVLAQLSHPNVVQVYEVGTHQGGVFIAMEFVRGKHLGSWLKQEAATIPRSRRVGAILRQFVAAGRGLEAAHKAGLAHRDVKPENVLVGDDGRVRVVDFGLARAVLDADSDQHAITVDPAPIKASERQVHEHPEQPTLTMTDPMSAQEIATMLGAGQTVNWQPDPGAKANTTAKADTTAKTDTATEEAAGPKAAAVVAAAAAAGRKVKLRLTESGMVVGTPRYMPPEQMSGDPADHRSDQFSFCVALYHALYGVWPYQGSNFLELVRAVTSDECHLPKHPTLPVPPPVGRALLRGLAREPADRFTDMGALLEALVKGPRQRRQRIHIGLASAIGVVFVLALVLLLPIIASGPDTHQEYQRSLARLWSPERQTKLQTQFEDSGLPYAKSTWLTVSSHLDDYVESLRGQAQSARADADQGRYSETIRDRRVVCLDQRRQRLGALLRGLEHSPAEALGDAIQNALPAVTGLPPAELCSDPAFLVDGPAPPASLAARAELMRIRSHLDDAITAKDLGRHQQALDIIAAQRSAVGKLDYLPLVAELDYHHGLALFGREDSGDIQAAEDKFRQALYRAEAVGDDALRIQVLNALVLLAGIYQYPSLDQGHDWSRLERAVITRTGEHPDAEIRASYALGKLHYRASDFAQAAQYQRQTVELAQTRPLMRANMPIYAHDLATTEAALGNTEKAAHYYQQAQDALVDQYGPDHPSAIRLALDYAALLLTTGQLDQAATVLESGLARAFKLHGAEHGLTGVFHRSLGQLHIARGDFDPAETELARAVAIFERSSAQLPQLFYAHLLRADRLLRAGDASAALAALNAAQAAVAQYASDQWHEHHLWVHARIAEAKLGLGALAEARAVCDRIDQLMTQNPSVSPDLGATYGTIKGRVLAAQGNPAHAIDVLTPVLDSFDQSHASPWDKAAAQAALARILATAKRADRTQAQALATEALRFYQDHLPGAQALHDRLKDWLDQAQ